MQCLQNGRRSNLGHNSGEYTFVTRCLPPESSAFAVFSRAVYWPPLPQILSFASGQSRLRSEVFLRRRHELSTCAALAETRSSLRCFLRRSRTQRPRRRTVYPQEIPGRGESEKPSGMTVHGLHEADGRKICLVKFSLESMSWLNSS